MIGLRTIFGALGAVLLTVAPVAAAPPNPVQALATIPQPAFNGAFATGSPMINGLNGANRNGWNDVGEQYGAMVPIDYGAIRGDAALVDKYWPAIDVAFAHQTSDGSFSFPPYVNGRPNDARGEPTSEGFFIGESAQALLLLQSSSLASRYAAQIQALIPKYQASLLWLSRPEHVQSMFNVDTIATNRILADAKALLLGDRLASVPQAREAGERLLSAALAAQSPEGYFPEHGGPDTSYNAVSCAHLAEILLFIDDSRGSQALARCEAWELSRIDPGGHVNESGNTRTGQGKVTATGAAYPVDYPHVIRMFAIYGALTGDATAIDAANRIAAYHNAHK
jgi:hypothetical protein